MTLQELSNAKNPDLRASFAAMQRAAEMARQIAIQTNTALVVVKDGKIVRIPAEQLRAQAITDSETK
jgi:imidazolonepropionase-like amidohydrolase